MARRVAASGSPSRILETACGTGIVTRAMRDSLPAHANLTATDFSPDMLKVTQAKMGPDDQVEFRPADGTALPFPDSYCDTVVCQFGMMFYPDKDKGFREAHRVLSPGGRYLFSVWDEHRHNPLGQISHAAIGSFYAQDPPNFFEVPFSYYRIDPIKESLRAAGFDGIDISVVRQRLEIADFSSFARGIVFGSPVNAQIMQRGEVPPEKIQDGITAALRRELGTEPTMVTQQAIIFEARKG